MIEATISGSVHGEPLAINPARGNPSVTLRLKTTTYRPLINAVAYEPSVRCALLALGDGDYADFNGTLHIGKRVDRNGTPRPDVTLFINGVTCPHADCLMRPWRFAGGDRLRRLVRWMRGLITPACA